MFLFFFNDTATTEIYTLSLHDALPICNVARARRVVGDKCQLSRTHDSDAAAEDRKSTRLNSSHSQISYAVFCLKKKKNKKIKIKQLKITKQKILHTLNHTLVLTLTSPH